MRQLSQGSETPTDRPLVSIVLVTYNRPAGLRDTLEDLLAQSYSDFELIICDDASPDPETAAICQNAADRDARVLYVRQAFNVGMPENLNSGIRRARGRYVAIAHDADRYDRNLIWYWLDAIASCPMALVVFNQYGALNERNSVVRIYKEALAQCNDGLEVIREFHRRWHFDSPIWGTVMASRSALMELGLFDAQYGFYADVDMWLRLAERGHVAYVSKPLIQLASRSTWPRQFTVTLREERRLVRSIILRSRVRVYRRRPVLLASQLLLHFLFCLLDDSYISVLALRRWFLAILYRRQAV